DWGLVEEAVMRTICRSTFSCAVIVVLALCAGPAASADPAAGAAAPDPALQALVRDYVGLYKAATLESWKKLFHSSLVVADPRPDGSVRVRNLEEFFGAQ